MTKPISTVAPAGPDPEPGADPATGMVLLERYEVRERISSGSSGFLWRAQDLLLRRDVALRLLLTSTDRDPVRARERAHLEGRAAARFQHPALAAIYDIAELDGDVVLVTELLRGRPLDRVLADRHLPAPLVARIGLHLAGGLAVAHAHGVAHGAVEPGRIVLGVTGAGEPDGTAALADLGVARLDGDPTSAPRDPGPADDLWALGATLHAALEGGPAGAAGPAPATPGRAGPLGPLLGALLAPDPGLRPDAHRTRSALQAICDAHDGTPDPEPVRHDAAEAMTAPQARVPAADGPPPTRTWTPSVARRPAPGRRRLVGAGLVGATGLLAAGVVGVVVTSMSSSTPTAGSTVAAPDLPAPLPPGPAAAPPITPADPGPAITAVPMDGDPVLTAATEDAASDREKSRDRDRDEDDRDDDRSERRDRDDSDDDRKSDRKDRDRDDDRGDRDREKDGDGGDRDGGDRDGGDRDGGDRDGGDRDGGDRDSGDSGDE